MLAFTAAAVLALLAAATVALFVFREELFGIDAPIRAAAAVALLLSRYCNQRDIVLGTVTAGRGAAELERLVGFFVNTLVLRVERLEDNLARVHLMRRLAVQRDAIQDCCWR